MHLLSIGAVSRWRIDWSISSRQGTELGNTSSFMRSPSKELLESENIEKTPGESPFTSMPIMHLPGAFHREFRELRALSESEPSGFVSSTTNAKFCRMLTYT